MLRMSGCWKYSLAFLGSVALILGLGRCTPIGTSTNKTLIHATGGAAPNPADPTGTSDPNSKTTVNDSTGTFRKALLLETPAFESLGAELDGDQGSPTSTLYLDSTQLKDLREHNQAIVHLDTPLPTDLTFVIAVTTLHPLLDGKSATTNDDQYVDVELKPISSGIWRLSLAAQQTVDTSDGAPLPRNIQKLMIRFTRIDRKSTR